MPTGYNKMLQNETLDRYMIRIKAAFYKNTLYGVNFDGMSFPA